MNQAAILERLFAQRPAFHRIGDTPEGFRAERSALPLRTRNYYASLTGRQDWGVQPAFGRFLFDAIHPNMQTLETGAGISTLIFAIGGAKHTAIAPWQDEMDAIRDYAAASGIDMSHINLVASPSQKILPTLDISGLLHRVHRWRPCISLANTRLVLYGRSSKGRRTYDPRRYRH